MKIEYWKGSHTVHRLMYHIVWIPKYRKRVLVGAIKNRLIELLHECAAMNRWSIIELNIQPDHVHMIVQLKQTVSVSKAVNLFKGGSSFVIRKEFPALEEFLWGDSFWSDGYFAETVGQCNLETIREYVQNQ